MNSVLCLRKYHLFQTPLCKAPAQRQMLYKMILILPLCHSVFPLHGLDGYDPLLAELTDVYAVYKLTV